MIAALLLSAAAVQATDEADAANLAFTQCLFATSRAASGEHLSPGAFEQRLSASCHAEQHALERAAPGVHPVAEEARRTVAEDYRRGIALQPEFEKLAKLCREQPDQCRQ